MALSNQLKHYSSIQGEILVEQFQQTERKKIHLVKKYKIGAKI